jgi:LacI family transcriptional regulator
LQTEPNWVGLYVAGGGITGVMRALREDGGRAAKRLVVIAHELTNETKAGLAEGLIKVVLSHPAKQLGETLVRAMAQALDTDRSPTVSQHIVPFDFYTATNI